MHDAHLEFQLAQTRSRLTGHQAAADDHDRLFQVRHLAQGERIAHRSQINYVAKAYAGHWRAHRAAAHRKAGLIEFNRLAVAQHSQPSIDIELRNGRPETRLDLMRLVPGCIDVRKFLEWWNLLAQKTLREHPALVRMKAFRADESDASAFVVFAQGFTNT